jgi:hypothetical protein
MANSCEAESNGGTRDIAVVLTVELRTTSRRSRRALAYTASLDNASGRASAITQYRSRAQMMSKIALVMSKNALVTRCTSTWQRSNGGYI